MRHLNPISRDQLSSPNNTQIVDINTTRSRQPLLDTENPRLARSTIASRRRDRIRACRAVVIEERVQARSINKDIWARDDTQSPSIGAIAADALAACREIRVVEACYDREHGASTGIGLPVCCLCLDLAGIDIGRTGKLILIESMMFDSGSDEPYVSKSWITIQTSAGVDSDLGFIRVVNIMIGCPQPCILNI